MVKLVTIKKNCFLEKKSILLRKSGKSQIWERFPMLRFCSGTQFLLSILKSGRVLYRLKPFQTIPGDYRLIGSKCRN
jgi:hypothetical protein